MEMPTVCGVETEYGLLVVNPEELTQEKAAVTFLLRCPLTPLIPWDMSGEQPGRDARDDSPFPVRSEEGPISAGEDSATGCHPGYLLGNGARLYADHGHPEYCTPECIDALDLVASDLAGERLLWRCCQHVNRFLPIDQSFRLFKNNTDYQGHSYGCHENYLLRASTYKALFRERQADLLGVLLPFLVSRIVVCGAGKVGSENGRPSVAFQLSQRADFFATVMGLQTMSDRPLINTRDEPHADPEQYRRLHVITGDANRAQVSTYLKIGTIQLLLAMLEDGVSLPSLELEDAVTAIVQISHDPTLRAEVPLRDGRRMTGVALQRLFAEAAQGFLARSPTARAAFSAVLERWSTVLETLEKDPSKLGGTLDWMIKYQLFEDWRSHRSLDVSDPQLKEMDLRYHDIDPEKSLYSLLERSGRVEALVDEGRVALAEQEPLSETRAKARARHLRAEPGMIKNGSWSTLFHVNAHGNLEQLALPPTSFEPGSPGNQIAYNLELTETSRGRRWLS